MNVWGLSDTGRVRTQNQDAFYLDAQREEGRAVCVVCDGMGGALAGNVASELAVETFFDGVKEGLRPLMGPKYMQKLLDDAAHRANRVVYERSMSSRDYTGMGTTLVAALVSGDVACVVNVGDSRAYYIDDQKIMRITRDHSVVEDMINKGDLTEEQARLFPGKNLITRALGTEQDVVCDHYVVKAEGGTLLLCTDGLTNVLSDGEIAEIVRREADLSRCCLELLELSNRRGAPDNVTVVVVSFRE